MLAATVRSFAYMPLRLLRSQHHIYVCGFFVCDCIL